jgi:hypothetical protein
MIASSTSSIQAPLTKRYTCGATPGSFRSGSRLACRPLLLVQEPQLNQELETIIPLVTEQLKALLLSKLEAIVLTGSFARGEGSIRRIGNRLTVLGDMEFLVFCSPGTSMTKVQKELVRQAQQLSARLAEQGIDCDLEFSSVTERYLHALRPHIFGYELLTHGRVVWGKPDILLSAHSFPPALIPAWDAWRMLNNRLLEQLQWAETLRNGDRSSLERTFYQILKCYIDIGTTLLIFGGRYRPTYASRAAELLRWSSDEHKMEFIPIISKRVEACTAFKLSPSSTRPPLDLELESASIEKLRADIERIFVELVPLAREVWRWEAAQLTGQQLDPRVDDNSLRNDTLRTQCWAEKLRGWAKLILMTVVRHQRGFGGRLGLLFSRGSPRYLIYCVASELYFKSPVVLRGEEPELAAVESLLPVVFQEHACEKRPWWRLRANVLSGWRLFLRNHWA